MSDPVLLRVEKRGAVLTLNRPEKINALNYETNDLLLALLDQIEQDEKIGIVIITGAGEQAFSAGGDIHEFSQPIKGGPDVAVRDFVRRGQTMTASLEAFPKPVIAAVNGGLDDSITEDRQIEGEQFARMAATQDCQEALDAWIKRRTPRYEGR